MSSQEIKILKNKGIGKKAFIFGAGPSVNNFNFDSFNDYLNNNIVETFVINDTVHLPIIPTFNVYRDKVYRDRLEERIKSKAFPKNIKVIGYSENLIRFADYMYTWHHFNNTNFIHSGADCLYICDHIINYDEIYLVGYDYNSNEKACHYYGAEKPETDYYKCEENRMMFKRALFKNGPKDFNRCEWSYNKIFNCNPKSSLNKFKFKIPWR